MPVPPMLGAARHALAFGVLMAACIVGASIWAGQTEAALIPVTPFILLVDGLVVWERFRSDAIRTQRGEIMLNDWH